MILGWKEISKYLGVSQDRVRYFIRFKGCPEGSLFKKGLTHYRVWSIREIDKWAGDAGLNLPR